jgi:hypothetical protein
MQEAAGSSLAQSATTFLTVMSALSTAVQQLVEHVIKKRNNWLDSATPADKTNEARRASAVHFLSFAVGAVLSWSVGLKPLLYLGIAPSAMTQGPVINALLAGVMISFGSSLFDEALGALREWNKAQEAARPKGS